MDALVTMKENYEFRRVYEKGRSAVDQLLVTYCFRRKKGNGIRFGFTSGKKIGHAVERNRSRRVMRAAVRELFPSLQGDWDIIFVARAATAKAKSTDVKKAMTKHLKKLGILL